MHAYKDPLSEIFAFAYGQTPAVFVPLPPPPVVSLVPAIVVAQEDDEDTTEIDPRDLNDVPLPEEPADFRAACALALADAANDDWPEIEPANDDDAPEIEPSVAVPSEEADKRPKRPQRQIARASQPRRPSEAPAPDFVTSPDMRSSDKLAAICAIVADPDLVASAKAVAAPLINKINPAAGYAYVSYQRLGEAAGVSWKTAQRAVRDLESAGWIVVDRVQGSTVHVAFRPAKVQEMAAAQVPKAASRQASRGARVTTTPDRAVPGSRADRAADAPETDVTPDRSVPPTPDRSVPSPPDRSVPHKGKDEGETGIEKREARTQNVPRPSASNGAPTDFDLEWVEFRDEYPVEVPDDTWRGAFIRARMEGYSLDQLIEAAHDVDLMRFGGQEMMCVAKFFADGRYMDNGRQPAFHKMKGLRENHRGDDDDGSDIPF